MIDRLISFISFIRRTLRGLLCDQCGLPLGDNDDCGGCIDHKVEMSCW